MSLKAQRSYVFESPNELGTILRLIKLNRFHRIYSRDHITWNNQR